MSSGSKWVTNDELTMEDINELISDCKVSQRLYQRLIFLKCVKKGFTIKEASNLVNVARQTGSNWLKRYNENGLDGLMPKFGGGRPSYLTDEQKNRLREIITTKNANYNIKEVRDLIEDEFNVNYTYKQAWVIVRKKFGLNYSKPFPNHDNRPETRRKKKKKYYMRESRH
jgi:putative transposase